MAPGGSVTGMPAPMTAGIHSSTSHTVRAPAFVVVTDRASLDHFGAGRYRKDDRLRTEVRACPAV